MIKVTDLKENEIIHCKTEDEFIKIADLLNDRMLRDCWDYYKEESYIRPYTKTYCGLSSREIDDIIYSASDFISPIYTIEDLREGRVAMLSNKNYNDTQRVLKAAYPKTDSAYGKYGILYYWSLGDNYYWYNSYNILDSSGSHLPIQSVGEFIKQLNNETMKSKTLNREQFKQIYNIACLDWKVKLMDQFKDLMIKDTVEVPDNYYKVMRKACTKEQHLLFDKIFGKDDNVVYLKDLNSCSEAIIVTNKDSKYYNHIIVYVSNNYAIDLTNNSYWNDSRDPHFNDVYGKRIKLDPAYKLLED